MQTSYLFRLIGTGLLFFFSRLSAFNGRYERTVQTTTGSQRFGTTTVRSWRRIVTSSIFLSLISNLEEKEEQFNR